MVDKKQMLIEKKRIFVVCKCGQPFDGTKEEIEVALRRHVKEFHNDHRFG